ncbi:MAG: tetratricopeptide repeat protein [Nitrosomonadales bacterium]|nr:tetratricopeptide repeat protein [Nitrosomonadales bacterium]
MPDDSKRSSFSFVPSSQPPAQQFTLVQAMAQATQLQSQGRLQEAEHLLRQILQQQPHHPFALHLLGVIAHQVGKKQLAVDLIQKAIQSNGNVALFHANLCEILRQLKRLDEAVAHGERAVALEPRMVMAHSNLGIAHFDRKDYGRAEACQQRALAIEPNFAPSLNNMGSIRREQKRHDEAIVWYSKAVAANPHYLEPLNNLGALLNEEDRTGEARATLNKALRINPNYAETVCNMGGVHLVLEEHDAAFACYRRALELRPVYVEAQMGLAKTYQALENLPDAETAALRALQFDTDNAKAHALLGGIYSEMAQPAQAEAQYDQALKLDPECDEALLGLGHLCMENGRMERAEELFRRSLAFKPDNLAARIHLIQVKKVKAGDENFAALLEEEKKLSGFSDNKAMSLHFALGKCHDDSKDYEKAFPHFLAGCKLKRAKLSYDPADAEKQFAALADIFDRATIDRLRGAGDPSALPIFVLGMPRSGTTLTEQIIASHPDVYGAGELHDLLRVAHRNITGTTDPIVFPDNLRSLDHATLIAWGAEYVAGLKRRAPGARRITDKMPASFFAVGLVHLMLPNAKIIHVNRNPVDTCLSCFTRLFNRKQEHTYDMAQLGRYYAGYARLMEHWRRVLPAGAFLDIHYESIVADQEAQARRMIGYCGLEWNDACLDFHNTERPIRTASLTQVRQPIYTTSVERWRSYEKFLGPLLDALGDLAPDRKR